MCGKSNVREIMSFNTPNNNYYQKWHKIIIDFNYGHGARDKELG